MSLRHDAIFVEDGARAARTTWGIDERGHGVGDALLAELGKRDDQAPCVVRPPITNDESELLE